MFTKLNSISRLFTRNFPIRKFSTNSCNNCPEGDIINRLYNIEQNQHIFYRKTLLNSCFIGVATAWLFAAFLRDTDSVVRVESMNIRDELREIKEELAEIKEDNKRLTKGYQLCNNIL